jgi:4-hydroxybenzoate polyprenyltransferase/phosphoserine phosphatase
MLLRYPSVLLLHLVNGPSPCDDLAMPVITRAAPAKVSTAVLCVDLDGTLIRGDLFWECILALLRTSPFTLLLTPFWLLSGRAALKRQLAACTELNPANLPYRQQVLDLLHREKAAGRHIVMATAADRELAESIAAYLGLFDEVHGSDGKTNLKGANKAAFLAERFAATGFEYIGDSAADVTVWRSSLGAYVVGSEARAEQAATVTTVKGTIFDSQPEAAASLGSSFRVWINALRGHHWAKNLLLFLPLALSHNLAPAPILRTLAGFALYCFCASGLYILNDLLDLHSDREHPWKQKRPFAAGDISIPEGLLAAFLLLCVSLSFGFLLNTSFGLALVGYSALTMLYSLYLKKIALIDVFVLSSFYSFRILAGALISATLLSQWFLAFSMFFFLSLAMAKRHSELLHASNLVTAGKSGRGYHIGDRELLLALGVGSSFSAVVILSLYVRSQDVRLLYSSPEFLTLLCPIVLYWLSRVWLQAHRGELREDPVTLAIRDPVSYGVALASAAVIGVSIVNVKW